MAHARPRCGLFRNAGEGPCHDSRTGCGDRPRSARRIGTGDERVQGVGSRRSALAAAAGRAAVAHRGDPPARDGAQRANRGSGFGGGGRPPRSARAGGGGARLHRDALPIGEVHGTAIAGIIAARAGDGIGIAGVAPDASLVALRACRPTAPSSTSICTSFTLAKALQYALDQDVQVINLSLGGPSDALLARLIDVAIARRIIVVAAADPEFPDGGFPASHRGVLAVAAAGAQNAPEHALVAPGRDIPATMPGRSWGFVNGSSFAAAEVSGARRPGPRARTRKRCGCRPSHADSGEGFRCREPSSSNG